MQVIPAIDLERGRSRIVYWPGAGAGIGAPTDRPDRIAERFVALGARLIHLVDFDGARAGAPANLETVGAVAARVAVPLQVAGGVDSAEGIQLAFAAGATRVVLTTAIADRPDDLRACLAVAGDWLAVGLDPRPERLAAFHWHRPVPPTVDEATDFLVEQTNFERANARAEVQWYTYRPTYPLSYLLGRTLLLELRADEQRRLGDRFDLKGFHDTLLRNGSLPISFHRRLLAGI